MRLSALAGSLALAWALPAQTASWLPLETGNTWLYRSVNLNSSRLVMPDYRLISVHGSEAIGGQEYFDVSYFGREVALRADPSTGSVVVYDPASGSEQPWLSLGLPVGGTFPTHIGPCPATAEIASRDASVDTPSGQFTGAVQVKFLGNCVDVGVLQQFYAPSVGLVSDEERTIFGALRYELVYYRVGSTAASTPEVSFLFATGSPQYSPGGRLEARLTLRSTSPSPIRLHFPSGQSFDLKILNDQGDIVYQWSKGRFFTMIVRDETFGPGERTYGLAAPLDGLPPGRYTAQGYLTTDPLMYLGQASFEIVPGQAPSAARNLPPGVVKAAGSCVLSE